MSKSFYKNAITLAAAILLIGITGRFALGQCTSAPSGMVNWWRGENNVNDSIGTSNATLANGATYAAGKVGQAFSFDGVDDYASMPASGNWAFGTGDFTVQFWEYADGDLYKRPLVNNRTNVQSENEWAIEVYNANNQVEFHSGYTILLTATNLLSSSSWNHIAVTRAGGTLTIYINGVASGSVANANNFSDINDLQLARDLLPPGSGDLVGPFQGKIDELSIIRRGLTATEIQAIFNAGTSGMCSVVCTPIPSGVVSWWPGENNANDVRGTNNGTLINGVTFASGKVGSAFNFGGSNDYVQVASPVGLPAGAAARTMMFWFKTPTVWGDTHQVIAQYGGNNGSGKFGLFMPSYYSRSLSFWGESDDLNGGTPLQLDTWYHGAVTYDGSTLRIFLNGLPDASQSKSLNTTLNATGLTIGRTSPTDLITSEWNGLVDEMLILDRALSQGEIQSIFNAGTGGICSAVCTPAQPDMVSWYRAENNFVDTLSAFNGASQNGAAFAPGMVGQAFSFDGSDDFISIPHNPAQNTGAQITIEAWVKRTSATIGATIFQKRSASNIGGYVFEASGSDPSALQFVIMIDGTYYFATTPPNSIGIGVWQHVAATYDGTAMKIYVDGVEKISEPRTGIIDAVSDPVVIGVNVVQQSFAWHGLIDEVGLYNRALSAAEIQATVNAGSLGKCSSCSAGTTNLVSWWTSNGHANDVIGVNHGDLTNGAAYATGRVGKAFSFNGANQYVLVGDPVPTSLRIQNEISLSAWIYATEYPGSDNLGLGLIVGSQYDTNLSGATIFLDGRTSPDGQPAPPGHIHFQIGDGAGWHTSNANSQVPLNQWVHIAATRKANEDAKIYYNGVLQPSTSVPWSGPISYAGAWFAIGQQKDLNRPFKGRIDEAQVHSRALTAAEITAMIDSGPFGTCAPVYPQPKPQFDVDGDLKADVAVFRPSGGEWWISKSGGGSFATQFGSSTDTVVPADYTGDGKMDIAYWRPSGGFWYILRSEDFTYFAFPFGGTGDIPAPADYDGDGKADAAVFRPTNTTWYMSWSTGPIRIRQFGLAGDMPVPGDYDGDRLADLAVFRPGGTNGAEWWLSLSSGGVFATQFGQPTNKAVAADFTGDKRTDIAVWDPASGFWYVLRSDDLSYYAFPFGAAGDMPIVGDFDGDGKADPGVFRPASANWYVNRSTAGIMIQQFGQTGDLPLENAYVR